MNYNLQVITKNSKNMEETLTLSTGEIADKIKLKHDIELLPQFTYIDSSRMIGGEDILLFLLSIPVGMATSITANIIYDWLTKNEIEQVRLNRTVIIVEEKEKTTKIIAEELNR
ncbi:hypothetical protein QUF58_08330 [Anaerolineales bacterium HSG24]|nr:hypothetical protein [Anaerolineales bacterium HSG24]